MRRPNEGCDNTTVVVKSASGGAGMGVDGAAVCGISASGRCAVDVSTGFRPAFAGLWRKELLPDITVKYRYQVGMVFWTGGDAVVARCRSMYGRQWHWRKRPGDNCNGHGD